MYQFSRAIYRELAPQILAPPPGAPAQQPRAVLQRLRGRRHAPGDRPPLLRAPRAHAVLRHPQLLPDVRAGARAPGRLPLRRLAQEFLDAAPARGLRRRQRRAAAVPRDHAQGLRLPAHAAAAQRLLPVAPAPRRHRGPRARRRLARRLRRRVGSGRAPRGRCRRHLHRRRPRRRRRRRSHRQGPLHARPTSRAACSTAVAARARARRRAAGRRRALRARHDRHDQRAAARAAPRAPR